MNVLSEIIVVIILVEINIVFEKTKYEYLASIYIVAQFVQ